MEIFMRIMVQTLFFLFTSIVLNGCLGNGNFHDFVKMQNNAIEKKYKVDDNWIKTYNGKLNPYRTPESRPNDVDSLPITKKIRDDGDYEYHWSLSAVDIYAQYYIYYDIVDKVTKQYIDWEFVYCDKDKIDFNDEETYEKKCLRDTRVTKELDGIYRVGVSRIFRNKYGYDYNDIATLEDNLKIVRDVLNQENLCKNDKIKIIRKVLVSVGGVRYMVECLSK